MLALAGIYSVMAFTVSQRTREIGIRIALGGSRRRVAAAIFRRPMRQVALGILSGVVLLGLLLLLGDGWPSLTLLLLMLSFAAFTAAVCMLALVVPARRAFRVEPTEALRWD
jgi:ABC-type antimicrobial peptide transport system permease subunit